MKQFGSLARATLIASLVATAACGQQQTAAPETEYGPALWRIADDDSEIYLFGTFHILPAGHQWTTPAFDDAMRKTSITMTEADVASPAAQAQLAELVQQYGLNPPGVTLSETIGPARAEQIKQLADRYGIPMTMLEPMRPWLALVSLTTIAMQKSGFDPAAGAESLVLSRANEENDEIAYLESAEFQIKALASLDQEEMLGNFDATIGEFGDFESFAQELLTAWSQGDVAVVERDIVDPLRNESPKAFEALIVSRNLTWVEKIVELLSGDDDVFIAVGAGHLIGEKSVIDLLEDKGIAVERIQ